MNISFTSNNYIRSHTDGIYEYKLEGFDNKWITGDQIIYTNIHPGNYKLWIREKKLSSDDIISKTTSMDIIIQHAWYANPYAYIMYFIIAYVILFSFMRFRKVRHDLKTSLEMERKEKEQIEKPVEMAPAKMSQTQT